MGMKFKKNLQNMQLKYISKKNMILTYDTCFYWNFLENV